VRWPPACELVSCSGELIVGHSPAGKNVSTDVEDIVGNRQEATTGEKTGD
jgi:hypothetical protein